MPEGDDDVFTDKPEEAEATEAAEAEEQKLEDGGSGGGSGGGTGSNGDSGSSNGLTPGWLLGLSLLVLIRGRRAHSRLHR